MTLGAGDTVLCSGTLGSGIILRERLAAAQAGGFTGLSLWGRDYEVARHEGLSDPDIRMLLADHGLSVAELDPGWWWLPGASEIHIPPEHDAERIFRFGERELFAVADAVGARSLNAVDVFGGAWSLDEAAAAFAGLCDRAAEHGLLVHLEFLPWSRIPDLATAWQVVNAADRPNGGIMLDAWHYFRGAPDGALLRSIPARPSSASSCATRRLCPRRICCTQPCTNGSCRATGSWHCPRCWPTSRRPARTRRSVSRCSPTCCTHSPRRRRAGRPATRCAGCTAAPEHVETKGCPFHDATDKMSDGSADTRSRPLRSEPANGGSHPLPNDDDVCCVNSITLPSKSP